MRTTISALRPSREGLRDLARGVAGRLTVPTFARKPQSAAAQRRAGRAAWLLASDGRPALLTTRRPS